MFHGFRKTAWQTFEMKKKKSFSRLDLKVVLYDSKDVTVPDFNITVKLIVQIPEMQVSQTSDKMYAFFFNFNFLFSPYFLFL